jgi:hypothetical protein
VKENAMTPHHELGPDDSQRVRTAAEEPVSDPERAIAGLRAAVVAHEQSDAWRWRLSVLGWTLVLAFGGWWAEHVLADAGAAAADHERLADMQSRLGRIEQQLDRLVDVRADALGSASFDLAPVDSVRSRH